MQSVEISISEANLRKNCRNTGNSLRRFVVLKLVFIQILK